MRKVTVVLVDDLDGSEISENSGKTVHLSFDGQSVELDLSHSNVEQLREALAPYLIAGRPVVAKSGRSPEKLVSKYELQVIRDWANANGHKVSERGRIAQTVQDAYARAHS